MSSPVAPLPAAGAAIDQRFALDVQGVASLRRAARSSPDEALRQVSRQFEALFMGMVLKSMRETVPASGLTDGQTGKLYQSMLDQQLAQHLSGRGLQLADAMHAQLRRTLPADQRAAPPATSEVTRRAEPSSLAPGSVPQRAPTGEPGIGGTALAAAAVSSPVPASRAVPATLPRLRVESAPVTPPANQLAQAEAVPSGLQARVERFVGQLGEAARAAAEATGIPERLILAQAALESGWGRREVRADDGSSSFNLFGIKADRSWKGAVTEALTTEVIGGVAHRVRARFRAYGSYEEAFADYARFLTGNRRYGAVVGQADADRAAHELQRAGYATDPDYARKLIRVMKRLAE